MKALVLHGNRDLRYEDYPMPEVKDDDVLIKVKAVGVCGSDVPRVLHNGAHFYPIVLGHEFAGEVVSYGKNVRDLSAGDRVAGVPLIPCKKCIDCTNGDYSLCKNYTFVGSRIQGAFGEYISLPKENVVKFDSSVSFEKGAFFEPSTVALHGIFRTDFNKGKDVAVLGCGTIGIFTLQWAKLLGAKTVTVFDISDERLALAKKFGADHTFNTADQNCRDDVNKIFDRGFDYVFETAGNSVTEKLCYEFCKNKGSICFIGTPTRDVTFTVKEMELINRKEFTLTGSWMSYSAPFPGKEWQMTSEYFSNGKLKISDSFIFKKYNLADAEHAFEDFLEPGKVKGKIMFTND